MVRVINMLCKHPNRVPEKNLKFPMDLDSWKTLDNQVIMRVDTGADVSYMGYHSFRTLFPKVQLKACPQMMQNYANSPANDQLQGEFQAFLEFRGIEVFEHFHCDSCQ